MSSFFSMEIHAIRWAVINYAWSYKRRITLKSKYNTLIVMQRWSNNAPTTKFLLPLKVERTRRRSRKRIKYNNNECAPLFDRERSKCCGARSMKWFWCVCVCVCGCECDWSAGSEHGICCKKICKRHLEFKCAFFRVWYLVRCTESLQL